MKCRNCGEEVEGKWKFCPRCGAPLSRKGKFFDEVFDRMQSQMKDIDKMFERDFEVFDLSPFFRKPAKGKGFSIKISRSGDKKPRVSVKTFGDVNREAVEDEARKLGIMDRLKPRKEMQSPGKRVDIGRVKRTEEPKTSVRNVMGRIVVEVKLPDVKREDDIEVNVRENSVEIKAVAGEKAYFKILTKPKTASITKKFFKDGILRLELG